MKKYENFCASPEDMSNITINRIISDSNEIISSIRIQDYQNASLILRRMITGVLSSDEQLCDISVMRELESVMEMDDMVYLADFLESCFIPLFQDICMEMEEEPIQTQSFTIESTSSGWKTIKRLSSGKYYHSNVDPMDEARIWIERIYDPDKYEYAVWGLGLGYHLYQLYIVSMGSVHLTVFYEKEEELWLSQEYGVLSLIPEDAVSLVLDPMARNFSHHIGMKECEMVMHFPSVLSIESDAVREIMHSFFAKWNGVHVCKTSLAINFRNNILYCEENVARLEDIFRGSTVVIIGGGPSLDGGMEYLKKIKGQKIMIVATTVLKKLLDEGIEPDYAVVLDSHSRTYGESGRVPNSAHC